MLIQTYMNCFVQWIPKEDILEDVFGRICSYTVKPKGLSVYVDPLYEPKPQKYFPKREKVIEVWNRGK